MTTLGSKRITESRLKTFAVTIGAVGVPLAILLFTLLMNLGVMTVDSSSGDMMCGGEVLCETVLYGVNFTADVFVYPMNGTWGLNASPSNSVEWIKLYRSWGVGWREINLSKTCAGTWCGGKSNYDNAFVFAFRKGKSYTLKFVAQKDEYSTVHWVFNPEGDWTPIKEEKIKKDKKSPLITTNLNCSIEEDTNYVGYDFTCLGVFVAGETVYDYEYVNVTEGNSSYILKNLTNTTHIPEHFDVDLIFNKTYVGLKSETPKKKDPFNVYNKNKYVNGSTFKYKFKTKEEVEKLEKDYQHPTWVHDGCYEPVNETWIDCYINKTWSKVLYTNNIPLGSIFDGDIERIGDASTIINFTTSNVLVNNSVNDVFIYDLTNDDDYTTWYNGTLTAVVNQGISLDGLLDDGMTVPDSNDFNVSAGDNKTYMFWFKLDGTGNANNWLFDYGHGIGGIFLAANHLNFDYDLYAGGVPVFNTANNLFSLNEWVHVTLTKAGNTWTLYQNATLIDSSTGAVTGAFAGDIFAIGWAYNVADTAGDMDDFTVFNRTLTSQEINDTYARGLQHLETNVADGLMAYWKMDDNTDDSSGRGHDGTLVGDATFTGYSSWWVSAGNKSFPLKSLLVASLGGLDILDASDNSSYLNYTDYSYDQVLARDGIVYTDNSSNFVQYSFIGDSLPSSTGLSREDNVWFNKVNNTETYWTNTTGFCRDNNPLNFGFSCDNFTALSNPTSVCSDSTYAYAGTQTIGLKQYHQGNLSFVTNLNVSTIGLFSDNVTDCDTVGGKVYVSTN